LPLIVVVPAWRKRCASILSITRSLFRRSLLQFDTLASRSGGIQLMENNNCEFLTGHNCWPKTLVVSI
jgi:hypothetical protein